MLRFLASPRALALHGGLIVCVAAFAVLASWQWDRAHTRVVDPATLARVPVTQVNEPGVQVAGAALGREVEAQGTYVAKDRYFIADRTHAGSRGYWVMVPLALSDATQIPVVRGFVAELDDPAARVPSGEVVVDGVLQASEDLSQIPPIALDSSRDDLLSGVATSELVGLIQGPLLPGWIAATSETPNPSPTIERLDPEDLAVESSGLRLQNVAYTVQWTVFALFVVFVYRRFLLDARADYDQERGRLGDSPPVEESV